MINISYTLFFSLAFLSSVAGCSIAPEKIWRLDEKPIAESSEMALLAKGSVKSFPNQIATRWNYQIKDINGKKFPADKSYAQLIPGEYKLTISCGARFTPLDEGWIQGEFSTMLQVKAGQRYFAWIGAAQDSYKIINGTLTSTTGRCWVDRFSDRNPFTSVSD